MVLPEQYARDGILDLFEKKKNIILYEFTFSNKKNKIVLKYFILIQSEKK